MLEPLTAYLAILEKQYGDGSFAGSYNIGPYDQDCITTQQLVELFFGEWGDGFSYRTDIDPNAPHEASFLKLDNSRVIEKIGWRPAWDIKTAVRKTVEWYLANPGWIAAIQQQKQFSEWVNKNYSGRGEK